MVCVRVYIVTAVPVAGFRYHAVVQSGVAFTMIEPTAELIPFLVCVIRLVAEEPCHSGIYADITDQFPDRFRIFVVIQVDAQRGNAVSPFALIADGCIAIPGSRFTISARMLVT